MPIKVDCECGQSFAAKDQMAGKTVKCPKCGRPLRIGSPRPAAAPAPGSDLGDLFDEIGVPAGAPTGGPLCPSCGKAMAPNAVLCTSCGFHLHTGQRVASSVSGGMGNASEAEKMVAKAAEEIAKTPISSGSQDFGDGTSPWAYVMVLAMPLIFMVALCGIMQWVQMLGFVFGFMLTGVTSLDPLILTMSIFLLLSTAPLTIAWMKITTAALNHNPFLGMACIMVLFVFVPIYGFIRGKDLTVWAIVYLVSGFFWFSSIAGTIVLMVVRGAFEAAGAA